ncbi:MAG: 50S ribosomal protein L23 [Alphaproteobacteria bacterium]|nr:50S ribosomal protein L23 [Alphaproteobacteria bacterium]
MKKTTVKEAKTEMTDRLYAVLRRPVITEKAMKVSEQGQITFAVPMDATKPEIKKAVEGVFGVKVKAVNTLCVGGKTKLFRGKKGVRSDMKKAIVTLVDGEKIDVTGIK